MMILELKIQILRKKRKNRPLIFTVNPGTGCNYIIQNMEDIYKLDFDPSPEEYSRLILELIEAGRITVDN